MNESDMEDMRRCSRCGRDNPAEARFCMYCGAALEAEEAAKAPPAAEPAAAPAAPAAAAAPTLAAAIVAAAAPSAVPLEKSPIELLREEFSARGIKVTQRHLEAVEAIMAHAGEECRQATAMFIDVSHFTSLSQQRPLDDIKSFLGQFYESASETILRNNGFIAKLLGDAVLAVFGAPVAFDRDAESAVRAALEIRDQVERLKTPWGERVRVKAGLATSEILSGLTRKGTQTVFDVFGPAVNLAERLQARANPGEVVVDEETHGLTEEVFLFEALPAVRLRHVTGRVRPYRVLAEKEEEAAGRRFATVFVGRGRELEALESEWRAVKEGGPLRLVSIEGEGGIGKTRLALEFVRRNALEDRLLSTECVARTIQVSFHVLMELFTRLAGVGPLDSRSQRTAKLRAHLRGAGAVERSEEAYIPWLLNAEDETALADVPPARRRATALALVRRHLGAVGSKGPFIWLIDDCHWIDASSREFLESLAQAGVGGWLVVMTARQGYEAPLSGGRPARRIVLRDLPQEQRSALLAQLLDLRLYVPELRELILERSGGNPLFIEELTLALRQRREKGEAISAGDLRRRAEELVPGSLRALLQSRIDLLERQTKTVLQCGAVLGRRFSVSLLELMEMIREGLRERLAILEGWDLLRQEGDLEGLLYLFKHGLAHEVAYRSLPPGRRRELHRLVAEQIETRHAGQLGPYQTQLAFHFERAEQWEKALHYALQGIRRSMGLASLSEALEQCGQCERLLAALPADSPSRAEQPSMLIWRARIERLLGDAERSLKTLNSVRAGAAGRRAPPELKARLSLEYGCSFQHLGRLDEARVRLRQARAAFLEAKDPRGEGQAMNAEVMCWLSAGRMAEAARLASQAIERLEGVEGARGDLGDLWNNLGLARWRQGRLDEATQAYGEAVRMRRESKDLLGLAATIMNRGILEEERRHDGRARASYENAIRLAERLGFRQAVCAAEANLGNLALRRERFDLAVEHNGRSLEIAREIGDRRSEAIALENLALAQMGLRDYRGASAMFAKARKLAERIGDAGRSLSVDLGRMELAIERGDSKEARRLSEQLQTSAALRDALDLRLRLRRLEAIVLHDAGRADEAIGAVQGAVKEAENASLADETQLGLALLAKWLHERGGKEEAGKVRGRLERFRRGK